MKIVIAPDSFKGCLTSEQACGFIEDGIRAANRSADIDGLHIVKLPIADGGEGTVSAFVNATNGQYVNARVHDPLMREIDASFGVLGDGQTAVIEMCAASGLTLLSQQERDPMSATTFGTGELIRAALDKGYRQMIIGVGGSATNDGGLGMAQALGIRFHDDRMELLGHGGGCLDKLASIDMSGLDSRIRECSITVACDVVNPLCGPAGASWVFAAQKGASDAQIIKLDQNLLHFAGIVEATVGIQLSDLPGAGAAGGLSGGLMAFLNAKLARGIDVIAQATGLEQHIAESDLVITGEGRIDGQTSFGKAPAGVAALALKHGVPVIGICGASHGDLEPLYANGFTAVYSVADGPISLEEAMHDSPQLLKKQAENIARLVFALKNSRT